MASDEAENMRETITRLDEAKDWLVIVESLLKHKRNAALATRCLMECRQRVADLKLSVATKMIRKFRVPRATPNPNQAGEERI